LSALEVEKGDCRHCAGVKVASHAPSSMEWLARAKLKHHKNQCHSILLSRSV
jgi:hypothetical protein